MANQPYQLYYWPTIAGRGEFVRLALEDAGAPYVDEARLHGIEPMLALLEASAKLTRPALAPPFLVHGDIAVGQTVQILNYLAPLIGLTPRKIVDRLWVNQLNLTIADLVVEVHDSHHPIASSLYFEDQTAPALARSRIFVAQRLPKFLSYFESVLKHNKARRNWLVAGNACTADLSLFQVLAGLRYAFPNAMAQMQGQYPRLRDLHDAVAERPNIARYLASERRLAFNQQGIFRHYPQLDAG